MENYPWYDVLKGDDQLLQGDFIKDCPIVIPPSELNEEEVEVEITTYNVVVMSQSCDLLTDKLEIVLVCPYWQLSEFVEKNPSYKSNKMKESLRRGYSPAYHLLNKCGIPNFESHYLVVDFRSVYGVSFNLIKALAQKEKQRLRLLSPYREHLSQSFARFFMRVGLPVDIPSFK